MSCTNNIRLEPMEQHHLDGVTEVERESFSVPWSRASFEGELKNKCAYYIVAEEGNRCVGYAGMHDAAGEADIINIAVAPEFRRRGIAQQLLDALVSECEKRDVELLHLDVRESNAAAIALYTKNGFVRDGLRKGYYSDNREAAILMTKQIIRKGTVR